MLFGIFQTSVHKLSMGLKFLGVGKTFSTFTNIFGIFWDFCIACVTICPIFVIIYLVFMFFTIQNRRMIRSCLSCPALSREAGRQAPPLAAPRDVGARVMVACGAPGVPGALGRRPTRGAATWPGPEGRPPYVGSPEKP